jgi:thioredoxin
MKKTTLFLILGITAMFTLQNLRRPSVNLDELSPLILHGDDSTFAELSTQSEWVLVDFWATWCGPCIRLKDELNTLAPLYENKVHFLAMNVDKTPGTTGQFGISGIPALVLLRNGVEVDRWTGFAPSTVLQHWIDGHVRGS